MKNIAGQEKNDSNQYTGVGSFDKRSVIVLPMQEVLGQLTADSLSR